MNGCDKENRVPIIDCQIHEVGPYWDWLGESTELQHKLLGELMIDRKSVV